MPQAALGAHQPRDESGNVIGCFNAASGTWRASTTGWGQEGDLVSCFNAASGTWRASTIELSCGEFEESTFQCRKRHLARINNSSHCVKECDNMSFNAASGTWRASTLPCGSRKPTIMFQCRKRHLARINYVVCRKE